MEVYRLLNRIINDFLYNDLSANTDVQRINITGAIMDDESIVKVNGVLIGLATITYDYKWLTLQRHSSWSSVCRCILENIDIMYLVKSKHSNNVVKFMQCLTKRRDIEPDIYLGYFLESVHCLMKNKSIKKMQIYKYDKVYKFNGQRFAMNRYRSDNDILAWEYDMKAIGWTFISSIGINRTEKIMKLVDISVSTE